MMNQYPTHNTTLPRQVRFQEESPMLAICFHATSSKEIVRKQLSFVGDIRHIEIMPYTNGQLDSMGLPKKPCVIVYYNSWQNKTISKHLPNFLKGEKINLYVGDSITQFRPIQTPYSNVLCLQIGKLYTLHKNGAIDALVHALENALIEAESSPQTSTKPQKRNANNTNSTNSTNSMKTAKALKAVKETKHSLRH